MLTQCVVPEKLMLDFGRRMGQLLADFAPETQPPLPLSSLSGVLPATNIWENQDAWFVELAAPGVKQDQISISVVGNDLNVQIDRPQVDETQNTGKYWRQERFDQSQSMTLALPGGVNSQDITAEIEDGILLIRLPKDEANQVKTIAVQTKQG